MFLNYAYIDTGRLLQNKNQQAAVNIREQYNIPANNKIIGTASYIYPPKFYQNGGIKGHDLLLGIFKRMLSERNDIYLIIAGTTFGANKTYENRLKKIAASINKERIIFTGKYDNAYSILSSFDVFVYLSKSENLGGVFESLLFEIPTVSSDRGGLPELVIDNETGYSCSLYDEGKIKLRITQMLDNPDAQLAFKEKGKQKVLKTFDKQRIIEQAYSIYLKAYKSNTVQEAK